MSESEGRGVRRITATGTTKIHEAGDGLLTVEPNGDGQVIVAVMEAGRSRTYGYHMLSGWYLIAEMDFSSGGEADG